MFKRLAPRFLVNLYHLINAACAATFYQFPAKNLQVIGVTGTDGKTTTSTLIYQILKASGYQVALISTVAAYIGNEEIDTGFHVTSPAPWQLQKLMKKIYKKGFKYVVLESTSHGLDQHRLLGTNIQTAVITNITHEHLDYHKNYDRYLKAKAKILKKAKTVVLNPEDSAYQKLLKLINKKSAVISYPDTKLPSVVLKTIEERFQENYNQQNAIEASLVGQFFHCPVPAITKAIKTFTGVPGRMEEIPNKFGFKVIVDFAHTPNALEQALMSVKKNTPKKLIAVYGCAGLRDRRKRPLMGEIGSRLADEVVFTAEDPRTEPLWSIIDQMTAGVKSNYGHVHKLPDRRKAVNFAISLAKPGDTVIICGKGHEKSLCFGHKEYPWSDQEAAITALKSRKNI